MEGDQNFQVIDESHKYFTMIPNVIDDLGLSVWAVRLYLRLKRRAGETGVCWENSRNLAAGCNMSRTQVLRAKKELEETGLITISKAKPKAGRFAGHIIKIVDIWLLNAVGYTKDLEKYHTFKGNPGYPTGHKPLTWSCGSPGPGPGVVHKKNPIKENPFAESSSDHCPLPKNGSGDVSTAGYHPAIKAIKEITGYYPNKAIYQEIVNLVGDNPDIEGMRKSFILWVSKGFNPQNIDGWLFDLYASGNQYIENQSILEYSEVQ